MRQRSPGGREGGKEGGRGLSRRRGGRDELTLLIEGEHGRSRGRGGGREGGRVPRPR